MNLCPHYIATYLYELSQAFNRFYENSRVIGDERQEIRIKLVEAYANTLKSGLGILGISAPDKM
jgi:arginyl-tRNA synthetase